MSDSENKVEEKPEEVEKKILGKYSSLVPHFIH